jgi:outer membrane protein
MPLKPRPVALLASAAVAMGAAANTQAADLVDVLERAQREGATFAQAKADYRAAREQWPQARAAVLPQINFSASTAEVDSTDNIDNNTVSFDRDTYQLELRQPLFDWEAFTGLDRADAAVAQAEAELAAARQDLIVRVTEAYFEVLTARDNLRFARAEKEAVERQLEQARQRFEVGLIPSTDVKEAQARFDLAVSDELEAQNALDQAREALRNITGQPVRDLESTDSSVPLNAPEPDATAAWVERALGQNPDFLAARSAAEAARHGMRQTRSGYLPEVELFARRQVNESSFTQGGRPMPVDETDDEIGIQLSWNLFAGGATNSRAAEARAQFQQAQARVTGTRRDVQQRARDGFRAVETAMAQVRALRQAVESSQSRVEATRSGFEVGTRTSVDVLNAVRDLYRAQRDLSEARNNYIVNRLRLKRAAGTLTEDDIRRVNAWLQGASTGESDTAG